nr:DUF4158 domain-containing protein [Nocardia amikacinitolerans]
MSGCRWWCWSAADLAFVDPGRGRGPAERLGLAITLCTSPWLGFVPERVVSAPPVAVTQVAEQLRVDPVEIGGYGRRAKTRTEHVRLAAQYLGWRAAAASTRHPPDPSAACAGSADHGIDPPVEACADDCP